MSRENTGLPPENDNSCDKNDWPETYYAVIFSSHLTGADPEGYQKVAEEMESAAKKMPGYLGIESARNSGGLGITISYWTDQKAIAHWKRQQTHQAAQEKGRTTWYKDYRVRVCKVERDYSFGQN